VGIELFRDGEQGFAALLAVNGQGNMLNIQRALNPSDARVHCAGCRRITWTPPRDATWTRAVRQGLSYVAARPRRLGARARREGHHQVRHLPTAGCFTRHVVKYRAGPADALSQAAESLGRGPA
jgi:hypothetical protein